MTYITGLETPRMLVLSTAHITRSTNEHLELMTDDVPATYYPKRHVDGTDCGWIIPIDPETPWSHMVSADLVGLRDLALSRGCTWIMLDQDADVIDEIPSYEW